MQKKPQSKLHNYLTSDFWRFNVDFCIQFVAVDYSKLALIGGGDVDDAFDMVLTEKTVIDHMNALVRMDELARKEAGLDDRHLLILPMRVEFFRLYNMTMKRLILLMHRVDYTGSPEEHKNISTIEQFHEVFCESVIKLSGAHLKSLTDHINDIDKKIRPEKKKKGKTKAKVFNFSELALDRLSRNKEDGN